MFSVGNPEALLDTIEDTFQSRVLERKGLTAALTDKVVVVFAGGEEHFVGSHSGHLDTPHEPMAVQQVERPIDAGQADPPAAITQKVMDLLGAEETSLVRQDLHHLVPRTSAA